MKTDNVLAALTPDDLYRHLVVFGATGCGKTRSVILPLLTRVLACDAGDADKRAGALIFDVKGDMGAHVAAVMKAVGRTDDVIVVGRGGTAWFDPFAGLENDSRSVAERLIEMVQGLHSGQIKGAYDDFWAENNRRFLHVAAILARARGLGQLGGIEGVGRAIEMICSVRSESDDDSGGDARTCISLAEGQKLIPSADAKMAAHYLKTEATDLSAQTWSIITNYAQAYLSCLRDGRLASVLTPSDRQQFVPEQVIDQGRVVLVSLSRVHFGRAAEVYRNMIKTAFQSCALQRFCRSHFDGQTVRPINDTRPVFFVCDEFPSFVTPGSADDGDAFFLDKCRETRISCILSAQSVSALTARMQPVARANHLLNNCCSKIFMATDCSETLDYFESAVPEGASKEEDVLLAHAPAPPSFRLPNYRFGPPQRWVPKSKTSSPSGGRKFAPAVLRELKTGEGIFLGPHGFAERIQFPPFVAAA